MPRTKVSNVYIEELTDLLSSRSFMVSGHIFEHLIQFEFIF